MEILSEIFCQFFGAEEIMDTKIEFDNVKYEKEKAMARFNMFQKMKKFLQVFELLVLLVLISWSANKIPSAAKLSFDFLSELRIYFQKSHVVFLMVICIILILVLLCKQNEVEFEYSVDDWEKCEIVEIQLPRGTEGGGAEEEMQVVVAVDERCDGLEVAIAEAEKKIRRFERTQSEKLRREIGVRERKELRRSETENGRGVVGGGDRRMEEGLSVVETEDGRGVVSGGDRRIVKSVDHLNNEEFKLAVDDFINKHRVFFKQQKIEEL